VGYLAVTVVVAALVVLVTFGSFGQLSRIQVKSVWLLLAGLAIQIGVTFAGIPRDLYDSVGFGLIMFSYVLILTFCFVNIGIRGIGLITIGIALNALVIGLNQGMPTRDQPITTASGRHIRKPIEPDVKHRAERSSDLLPFLSDIIWLPAPFEDEAISFGDLILAVGICELAYYASRRRYTRGTGAPEEMPGDQALVVPVDEPDGEAVPLDEEVAVEATARGPNAEPGPGPDAEPGTEPEAGAELADDADADAEAPATRTGKVALTPTLDQRMGMSAPRRSRTRSNAPSTRPS
jgi:hypothetical protein